MKDVRALSGMTFNLWNNNQKNSSNIYHILHFSVGDEKHFPDVISSVPVDQLNCILFTEQDKKYFFVSLQ